MDEQYLIQATKQLGHFVDPKPIRIGFVTYLLAFVMLIAAGTVQQGKHLMLIMMCIVLVAAGIGLVTPYVVRRLHKSPMYREWLEVSFHEHGIRFDGESSHSFMQWSAYNKAVRAPDGIVLSQGPTTCTWLPDTALTAGSLDDVLDLLERNIPEYTGGHPNVNSYAITFDDTYFRQLHQRYRRRRGYNAILMFRIILGVLMAIFLSYFIVEQYTDAAVITGILTAGWVALILYSRNKRRQNYRQLPVYDHEASVTLAADGITTDCPHELSSQAWSAYNKARRFRHGTLLFQGPILCLWLPDDALATGSVADVNALIEANIPDYKIIEH
jgi:hypothetical protein